MYGVHCIVDEGDDKMGKSPLLAVNSNMMMAFFDGCFDLRISSENNAMMPLKNASREDELTCADNTHINQPMVRMNPMFK